jgi:hypothetical protein
MGIKYCNREVSITKNKFFHVYFIKQDILCGKSFSLKKLNEKSFKEIILYLVMPYEWLNKRFLNS